MVSDKLLEVSNLTIDFRDGDRGWRRVVSGISYQLGRGEALGIVGESGSGKTVSTMSLIGLLPDSVKVSGKAVMRTRQGEVDLLTLDEKGYRDIRGKGISMVFQEPMTSLNPVQKCGNQVMEMMKAHHNEECGMRNKELKQKVVELFEEVRLPRPEKIFDSYPHELSGGQKQRVMIAMALICEPELLIADEPTTALDVTVQKTILELLRQLQRKRNMSVIFITHDLGVVAQVADRIAVMRNGEIVEIDDAALVLHSPKHPYTKGLLACRAENGQCSHLRLADAKAESGQCSHLRLADVNAESGQCSHLRLADVKAENGQCSHLRLADVKAETEEGRVLMSVRDLNVEYVLKKSFLGRPLQKLKGVDNVSFDIMEGETLGLVGESGCGKSTLGRALLRLIDSKSGKITYRGTRLDTLSANEMRALRPKLQIIFQDPYSSLNPRMTVGEAISEPLRVHGDKTTRDKRVIKEQVVDLMERVGLEADWYNRYPHQFSGGQRQRVCIARALILNPELVICDESVSALDVSVQAQVLNLLGELKEHYGYTYLFISHDLSVVHYMADRVMVMRSGKIVEYGDTEEVYSSPKEEYTRTLLDAIPRIE